MPDDQLFDVAKLGDGEICGKRCLHAFFADDSKTNVCFLDHCDVVSTVTDAGDHFSSEVLDVDGDNSFLSWAATADTDCLSCLGHREELLT